jgi:hypothetical protein
VKPDAIPAFNRIVERLRRSGQWEPIFEITAEHAAESCAFYLQLAKGRFHPADIEQTRQVARAWLVEMNYLDPGRASVGLMTADGLDADIVAICA